MLLFTFHLQCYSQSSTVYLLTLKSFSDAFLEETAHLVSCTRPCWITELELNLFGAAAIMKQNVNSFWIDFIWLEDRRGGFSSCVHRSAQETWVHYIYSTRKERRSDEVREAISQSGSLQFSLSLPTWVPVNPALIPSLSQLDAASEWMAVCISSEELSSVVCWSTLMETTGVWWKCRPPSQVESQSLHYLSIIQIQILLLSVSPTSTYSCGPGQGFPPDS